MRVITVALGAAGLAIMAGGIYAIHERRSARAERPTATESNEEAAAAVTAEAVRSARPPRAFSAREQVQEVIERRLPEIKTTADMERYLAEVEARARANRQVTALEIEPAVAAIRQMQPELGPERTMERTLEFTQRMNKLAAELAARDHAVPPPPDLDQLARQIEHGAGGDGRQAAIRAYAEAVRDLPPADQPRATARLNELARRPP